MSRICAFYDTYDSTYDRCLIIINTSGSVSHRITYAFVEVNG